MSVMTLTRRAFWLLVLLLAVGCEPNESAIGGAEPLTPETPDETLPPSEEKPGNPAAWNSRYPAKIGGDLMEIHFTRPGVERDSQEDPEADDAIIAAIDSATASVDMCLYEFNRANVVAAAEAAVMRGVQVRFVGDGDELHDPGYEALAALGVEMSTRKPADRIMHNKYVVVDARTVFTGSMNYSENGVMLNNNNLLRINDEDLADIYAEDFQQMFDGNLFGRKKVASGGGRSIELADGQIEIFFSPQDNPIEDLRRYMATAQHSVYFMIFSYTQVDLTADMKALHDSGIEVVGVFDESQARGRYSVDEQLAAHGVPVYIDGNLNHRGFAGGKLHHKVMLIDAGTDSEPMVVSGSFNWSNSATRYNDENLVIMKGAQFVAPFLEEFCRVVDVATIHPEYEGSAPDPCASLLVPVRINEVLANPDGSDTDEEFVELVNNGPAPISLDGWTLGDIVNPNRHVFGDVVLPPGGSVVVHSGANALEPDRLVATSGALSLNNNAETVTLTDAEGAVVDSVSYTAAPSGVSFNRSPDGAPDGPFVAHNTLSEQSMSPGLKVDGNLWPGVPRVFINEFLANPEGTDRGNEYVEIANTGTAAVDMTGWTLGDSTNPARHVFDGTVLVPGDAVVVFDSGEHDAVHGAMNATSGLLSLQNVGDTVVLHDAEGKLIDTISYDSGTSGVALNRNPDGQHDGEVVLHNTFSENPSSAGLRADGSLWITPPPELKVIINEVLPNPVGADLGQEFVELINVGEGVVQLDGWSIGDAVSDDRHVFAGGISLAVGEAIVVFDRGEHADVPGATLSSSGSLSLNNGGDSITLYQADGAVMDSIVYTESIEGMSKNRDVDGVQAAEMVDHADAEDAVGTSSPGLRASGAAW